MMMTKFLKVAAPILFLALAALGCRKPQPIKPKKPVPPGSMLLIFTRPVTGPVDLTLDGHRIPVTPVKGKAKQLMVSGIQPGPHVLVLLSPVEAFGPDQLDFEMPADKGGFSVLFTQTFKATLYGKTEPTPAAEGLPGVSARLEK